MADTLIERLEKLILEKFKIIQTVEGKNKLVRLRERKNEEKIHEHLCQGVEFKIISKVEFVGFCFDHDREKGKPDPIFPYFNTTYKGICTKNDAVLFCKNKTSSAFYVLLIDLKSTNVGGWLDQVKAARVFVEFILQRVFITQHIQPPKVEYRGICFRTVRKTPNEGTTRKKETRYPEEKIEVEYEGNEETLLYVSMPCHFRYDIQDFLK